MVARQNALHNMDAHLIADLPYDLADALSHFTV